MLGHGAGAGRAASVVLAWTGCLAGVVAVAVVSVWVVRCWQDWACKLPVSVQTLWGINQRICQGPINQIPSFGDESHDSTFPLAPGLHTSSAWLTTEFRAGTQGKSRLLFNGRRDGPDQSRFWETDLPEPWRPTPMVLASGTAQAQEISAPNKRYRDESAWGASQWLTPVKRQG
jgi:hypothetical protein